MLQKLRLLLVLAVTLCYRIGQCYTSARRIGTGNSKTLRTAAAVETSQTDIALVVLTVGATATVIGGVLLPVLVVVVVGD